MILWVVDDDDHVRASLRLLFHSRGVGSREFASGRAFFEAASASLPELVLLDYRMAQLDGLEVLRQMREHGINCPVVMMSGHGDRGFDATARELGAAVLLKPFEEEQLWATLQQVGAGNGFEI